MTTTELENIKTDLNTIADKIEGLRSSMIPTNECREWLLVDAYLKTSEQCMRNAIRECGYTPVRTSEFLLKKNESLAAAVPAKTRSSWRTPLSACCGAVMTVAGGKEGTRWYECSQCGKACDAAVTQPGEDEEGKL